MSEETPAVTQPGNAEVAHSSWTPEGEAAPKVSDAAVLDALGTVYDPEIPVNIYELGLIYEVEITDEQMVKVQMTLTTPSCPSAQELPAQVEQALRDVPGVSDVQVEVVWDPPWDPSRMSEDAKLALNMHD